MRCGSLHSSDLRKGIKPNKTVEELNPESNHSVQSLIGNSYALSSLQLAETERDSQIDFTDRDSEIESTQATTTDLTESQQREVQELLTDPFPHPESPIRNPEKSTQNSRSEMPNIKREESPKPRVKWPANSAKQL